MSWEGIAEFLAQVSAFCTVEPLTLNTHNRVRAVAQRYSVSFYDASIASVALIADCRWLVTEDLQGGMVFEKVLTVVNPFSDP